MAKDEQVAEDQALVQIAYKILTTIITANNVNNNDSVAAKTTPSFKSCYN